MIRKKSAIEIINSFSTPSLILIPDSPRFTIADVNRAYIRVTKSGRDELVSRGLFEAFPANPADPDGSGKRNLTSSLERVIATGKPHDMDIQRFDIPVRGTDRFEVKFWNPENTPIYNEGGEIEFILHTIHDVTDRVLRKKAEDGLIKADRNLRESNTRLTTILESITDGFYAVNWEWIVTYWNKEAEKLLKKSREEVLGRNLWDVYPPSDSSMLLILYTKYHNVMKKRVSSSFQEYYEPLDTWFDVRAYPSENGISVFFKDITEQKRAESEREHLMHVVENSVNEIYIFDSETLLFTYLNEGALLNLGYTAEQMSGMTPLDISPEHTLLSFCELTELLKKGQKKKLIFETNHKRADGTLYPVEVHLQLAKDKSVFLAMIMDITDRKRVENEREQLIGELTRNNRDLRQFSYITSHNLRAPIANQESLVHLLEGIPVENAELREILDDIKMSVKVLRDTVGDLTDILIIKDNPSVELELISFAKTFEHVLRQTQYLIRETLPEIHTDFEQAPYLRFNQAYLESIFLNLVTNAIKFRSPARQLVITAVTKNIRDYILLEFQDNGVGLDISHHKERFFGLYQKFHDHTDSKGLGLYLVKSQVEALGGSIEATSEVNKGMKILIRFKKQPL